VADYLPPVVVEITGRDDALARTLDEAKAKVRAFAAEVGKIRASMHVDADTARAREDIDRFAQDAKRLRADVKVNADQTALGRAREQLDMLARDRTARIVTHVVTEGGGGGSQSKSASDTSGVTSAIKKVDTALSAAAFNKFALAGAAAFGAVAQAAGGLAAGAVAAGAAVGAFGLAVKPQFTAIASVSALAQKALDAQGKGATQAAAANKAYAQALGKLPPATRQTAMAFLSLKEAYKGWSDGLASSTMPIFTEALQKVQGLLPKLSPLVRTASATFKGFLDNLGAGGAGATFSALGRNIEAFAGQDLGHLLNAFKNIGTGIAGILNAFMPFSGQITGGLDKITARFAAWGAQLGGSSGFKQFMDTLKQNGPGISQALESIAKASGKVALALEGFGSGTFKLFEVFANSIAKIPTPVLQTLANILPFVAAGMKAAALATTMFDAASDANPIGAMVLGLELEAAALYLLWTRSQTFREVVTEAFSATAMAALAFAKVSLSAFGWVQDAFLGWASFMVNAAAVAFGWVPGIGPKLRGAAAAIDALKQSSDASVTAMIAKLSQWQNKVLTLPDKIKIQGDITDLQKKISDAQQQIKSLPLSKQAKLSADITNWQLQVAKAKAVLENAPGKKVAVFQAQISQWQAQISKASAQLRSAPASKRAVLTAEIADLQRKIAAARAAISSVHGKTVAINIVTTHTTSGTVFHEGGNYADGGLVRGGKIRAAADGLQSRQATMLGGGSNVLWAEDSTGGEAYIPLSPAKRVRSRQIAASTVAILGGRVAWNSTARAAPAAAGAAAVLATGGGSGSGGTVVQVTVQGTVTSEQNLINTIEQGLLRKGMRRSATYQPYNR
jgi:hypothetical protein